MTAGFFRNGVVGCRIGGRARAEEGTGMGSAGGWWREERVRSRTKIDKAASQVTLVSSSLRRGGGKAAER